ncbi:MAG: hypothetical protein Q9184_008131, partial [Pyrenodesmia sp. 2 TL-2023]
ELRPLEPECPLAVRSSLESSLISADPPKEVLKAAMKGFRQAMLLEQMLKWASTIDQMTKKTPPKV